MSLVRQLARGHLGLFVVLAIVVGAATVIGSLGGTTTDRATVNGLILLILVVGLWLFVGGSGVFSFGHAAFMGLGAYTTAIVTMSDVQQGIQLGDLPAAVGDLQLSPVVAVLASALVAAVFALVISIPLMRLSGLTASLATVAVLITMRVVFQNLETYTRGTRGLFLDAPAPTAPQVLAWALGVLAIGVMFKRSRVGIRLAASREDELAARSIGIRVWWERGIAFVLSAAVTGAGGSLFALYFGSLNPDTFYLSLTFTLVAMLVIGGFTSLSGAVLGTVSLTAILELLRLVERGLTFGPITVPSRPGLTETGSAVVLLVILIARPGGITGGRELTARRRPVAGALAVAAAGGALAAVDDTSDRSNGATPHGVAVGEDR